MRRRSFLSLLTLALLATATLVVSAQSMEPWVGTWKLNIAKSKYNAGPAPAAPTANTTKLEIVNGVMRITTDTVNAQGQKNQVVRYVHFGTKEQGQASGNPAAASVTYVYTSIDPRTYQWVTRVDGKVTTTTRLVLSPDGKTQTLTTTGTDAQGQAVNSVTMFERQ